MRTCVYGRYAPDMKVKTSHCLEKNGSSGCGDTPVDRGVRRIFLVGNYESGNSHCT